MIASNYRQHPEALALQLPLPFPRLFRWHVSRPTTRAGRAIRAHNAAAFKTKGYTQAIEQKTCPAWVAAAAKAARSLARTVKTACMAIQFDERERLTRTYAEKPPTNGYAKYLMNYRLMQASTGLMH